MCVTNFVKRNPRPLAVSANPAMISSKPSLVSLRLMGNFMPLMMNASIAKPSSAVVSTTSQLTVAGPQHNILPINNTMAGAPDGQKSRPKRRRKPQKPGLTAKVSRD